MKPALFLIFLWISVFVSAQTPNWQNKDLQKDSVFGIGTDRAYSSLLKHKRAKTVLVAVIDGGVDTAHEDLKAVIWNNPGETVNGIDDDHNGYADDLHGWDFIGGPCGDVRYETLELTRLIRKEQSAYDSLTNAELPGRYRKMKAEYDKQFSEAQKMVSGVSRFKGVLDSITQKIGKEDPSEEDFRDFRPGDDHEKRVRELVLHQLQGNPDFSAFTKDINNTLDHFKTELNYHLNLAYNPRSVVGDDVRDSVQRNYGNNDVMGPDAHHGSHVSGIIGAVRNNQIGINGVADHVQIMSVRVVPDGDERDKDVANGIRYAADNGARVINMSFGKGYSPQKSVVDDAVKYAMSRDVLIVHAAGNEGINLDSTDNFPNRRYVQGGEAGAWIEVGASDMKDDSTLVANFSNYGKINVDVFAPGVQIYSTTPGSQYDYYSGTSMASPVVAGLAALIREYYPKLTALQVKEIILQSVSRVDHPVIVKDGSGNRRLVPFSSLCVSGGIVNTYNALLLAKHFKKRR